MPCVYWRQKSITLPAALTYRASTSVSEMPATHFYLWLAIVALHASRYTGFEWSLQGIRNIIKIAGDKNVKRLDTKSRLHCAQECFKRQNCKLFLVNYVRISRVYKCVLDLNPGSGSEYTPVLSCESTGGFIDKYPRVSTSLCEFWSQIPYS